MKFKFHTREGLFYDNWVQYSLQIIDFYGTLRGDI